MWKLQAEDLLAAHDVGLIPWVPLTATTLPPEELLTRCRDEIEHRAPADEKSSLLAVFQLLAAMVFPNRKLLDIFGGSKAMIESPYMEEIKQMIADDLTAKVTAKATAAATIMATIAALRSAVIGIIEARFGSFPNGHLPALEAITEETRLRQLLRLSAICPTVDAFVGDLERCN